MATSPIQSAITPESVAAAQIEFDAQDRAVLVAGGQRTLLNFQLTGLLACQLAPREWEEVAAYLCALLEREPVKSSPGYSAHRIVLGSIAGELRGYARVAGEPVGLEADLRAATTKADERRILDRMDDQHRAQVRRLDEVALQQAAQHRAPDPVDEEAWTRPSGDWLADAAAADDHDRHHDHEEAPNGDAPAMDDDELPAFLR
jgi:hypothetical protein